MEQQHEGKKNVISVLIAFVTGNNIIHAITSVETHELRIDIESFEGDQAYAAYSNFTIGSASEHYVLNIDGYTGTAGKVYFQ